MISQSEMINTEDVEELRLNPSSQMKLTDLATHRREDKPTEIFKRLKNLNADLADYFNVGG